MHSVCGSACLRAYSPWRAAACEPVLPGGAARRRGLGSAPRRAAAPIPAGGATSAASDDVARCARGSSALVEAIAGWGAGDRVRPAARVPARRAPRSSAGRGRARAQSGRDPRAAVCDDPPCCTCGTGVHVRRRRRARGTSSTAGQAGIVRGAQIRARRAVRRSACHRLRAGSGSAGTSTRCSLRASRFSNR